MTDVSTILGIALVGVGAASAVYGGILCYTTKVCKKFWVLEFLPGLCKINLIFYKSQHVSCLNNFFEFFDGIFVDKSLLNTSLI